MATSALALEALLEEASPRLLQAVLDTSESRALKGLAQRWYQDKRPEVRRALHEYIDDGLLRPNHQPLSKKIFKLAEAAQDNETMAHLMVACDRMARRRLVRRGRYDWSTRTYSEWQALTAAAGIPKRSPTRGLKPVNGACPKPPSARYHDPYTGRVKEHQLSHLATYTFRTRRYLARRAWRYFRQLASTDAVAYRDAMTLALTLYEDEHLSDPMQLLDAWGLVHALYHDSPLLEQGRPGWFVKPGCALGDLDFAPFCAEVWQRDAAPLFDLVARARARTVRLFALHQLRTHHASSLQGVAFEQVQRFLASPHEEVMLLGAELFEAADGLHLLSIPQWKALLSVNNAFAQPAIVAAFDASVRPERLDDAALIELTASTNAPAAGLGLKWLKQRPVPSQPDLRARLILAEAPADTVRIEACAWLCELIAQSNFSSREDVRELLDARHEHVRTAALAVVQGQERFARDPLLWSAMSETPYDDVRGALLKRLDREASGLDDSSLRRVWASVLLAVHRGSRAKARAAKQIAAHLVKEPARADELLPLLAISLRSLRRPDKASALAAVARAVFRHPSLSGKMQALLPGLTLEEGPQ